MVENDTWARCPVPGGFAPSTIKELRKAPEAPATPVHTGTGAVGVALSNYAVVRVDRRCVVGLVTWQWTLTDREDVLVQCPATCARAVCTSLPARRCRR